MFYVSKFLFFFVGPPAGFCLGKSDGAYANPKNQHQFFFCNTEKSSKCKECDFGGVFQAECGRCLPLGTRKCNFLFHSKN